MKNELLEIQLLSLANDPLNGRPLQTKVHSKHLKRMRELRLVRPLTSLLAPQIAEFKGLKQVYLDGGIESPSVLNDIALAWRGDQTLQVILGISGISPQILMKECPSLKFATFDIKAGETKFFNDATSARFSVSADLSLPQPFEQWKNLRQLEIEIEFGGNVSLSNLPKGLSVLRIYLGNNGEFGIIEARGENLQTSGFYISIQKSFLKGVQLTTKGDLLLFSTFRTTLKSESFLLTVLDSFKSLHLVELGVEEGFSKSEIERVVAIIASHGPKVTARKGSGMFKAEEFKSDTGQWIEISER